MTTKVDLNIARTEASSGSEIGEAGGASDALTFVATAGQARSVHRRWRERRGRRTAVCLDEGLLPRDAAARIFGDGVDVIGISDLGLDPAEILQESMALAEELYPASDTSLPGRINRWMLALHRYWLLHQLHAIRVVEAGLDRYRPQSVWLPAYDPARLRLDPREHPEDPLVFEVLVNVCQRAGIRLYGTRPPVHRGLDVIRRLLIPIKYVVGQWLATRFPGDCAPPTEAIRPVMVAHIDNDFHRHFDLGKLGAAASQMNAWIRGEERIVSVDRLLERVGRPSSFKFAWLAHRRAETRNFGHAAGAGVRTFAGLKYVWKFFWHELKERGRRLKVASEYGIRPFGLWNCELPAVYSECLLAAAYYCVLEYERARTMLIRWKPELLITSDYWSAIPHLVAARDLRITTLITQNGITLFRTVVDEGAKGYSDLACVYGFRLEQRFAKCWPRVRTIRAGDSLARRTRPAVPRRSARPRMLLVTSGRWYGWWMGSLVFNYPKYTESLLLLQDRLSRWRPAPEVLLKSHPVSDLHELYDSLARRDRGLLEHRTEPMTAAELTGFDVAVMFSGLSTLLAEIISARIPVVFFSGGLSEFGKKFFEHDGLLQAETVGELIDHLSRLLGDDPSDSWGEALSRGETFLEQHASGRSRSFDWVLHEIFGGENRLAVTKANLKCRGASRVSSSGEDPGRHDVAQSLTLATQIDFLVK